MDINELVNYLSVLVMRNDMPNGFSVCCHAQAWCSRVYYGKHTRTFCGFCGKECDVFKDDGENWGGL